MKDISASAVHAAPRRYATEGEDRKGLVFFLHGFGLHADKFAALYTQLNDLGYDVVTHDMLGHGRLRHVALTTRNLDEAVEHSLSLYRTFVSERPIMLGVGLFGGFMMQRIMAATVEDPWQPPSVLYSVDPAPLPLPLLRALDRRRGLLERLDRLHFGYDHRSLTHDPWDDVHFVEEDPTCWTRFPLGVSMMASHGLNAFYADPDPAYAERHALIYGTDNRLCPIERVRGYVTQHPTRFRLFEVEGGAFHLHRDDDVVRERFCAQLDAAFDYVADAAECPRAERPPEVGGPDGMGPAAASKLLTALMFDPIGTIDRAVAEHGSCFTLPIPFGITPPFTFLTTREGYRRVLDLPPDVGRNGPIIDRVPALAHWAPRSDRSPEHLQTLLLTGRRFIGHRLRQRRLTELREDIARRTRSKVASWNESIDLSTAVVELIHETSSRLLLGDELWTALGPDTLDDVRTIANAVDAARATLALSPAARLLPEYRATKRLGKRLLKLARQPETQQDDFVRGLTSLEREGQTLPAEDVAWMMFFAVWNATLYSGTYGVWSYLDLLTHPLALARARSLDDREAYLTGAVVETMRLNPISWQLRSLASDVTVESEGRRYQVPAGHFLSVFSYRLNRDPEVYVDPQAWDPSRYDRGAIPPLLFGTGPFSCVAQRWVKLLLSTVLSTLIDEVEVELLDDLPRRISRVHLLYPDRPIAARIHRR